MVLLQKFKVSGHSMEPGLKPGQEILVSYLPYLFSSPRIGDIIAFSFAGSELIVKRITEVKEDKCLVKGDNKQDSKKFGWIDKGKIIGKVIHILDK